MPKSADPIETIKLITETWRPHVPVLSHVRVQYEFLIGASIEYYVVEIRDDGAHYSAGQLPDSESDIIIRALPETMVKVLVGEMGAREAMMGGLLDVRKVSSMPQLLVLRGLFSQYKKEAYQSAGTHGNDETPVNDCHSERQIDD